MDERERKHFAVIAEHMAEERKARGQAARALDPLERVKLGLSLARPFVGRSAAIEAAAERRMLAQAELHRRWERLHPQGK